MDVLNLLTNSDFWFGVLRSTTPILFAALASLMSSISGITNMALEGAILFAALFAVIGSALTGNIWIGLLFAVAISVALTLALGFFKMRLKADEIMVAIAINLLATGGTVFILYLLTGNKSTSSALPSGVFPTLHIPLIENIPFIGNVVSGHNILVYVAFLSIFVIYYLLYQTSLGLRIRSIGGNEEAAESVGVSVEKTRYTALFISGYLTIFTAGMTAGRGYIALAASFVGGNNPFGTMLASGLFGLFDQLGNQLQSITNTPQEFIFMIPYIATVVMYTIFAYRRSTRQQRANKKLMKQREVDVQ